MERGKNIMTRRGQASALGKRRMRRVMVMLEQQPQSKNIKPADAEAFRSAILERLEKFGRVAFRGDVFLQMDFFTTAKDPPAIYSLPKNYIDLLWKHGKVLDGTRPRLLLRDDRQVKALIVRYHLGLSGKSGVWLRAEPFRDFLADAHLVKRISQDDFEDNERVRWRGSSTDALANGPSLRLWQEPRPEAIFATLAAFDLMMLPLTIGLVGAGPNPHAIQKIKGYHDSLIIAMQFFRKESQDMELRPKADRVLIEKAFDLLSHCETYAMLVNMHVGYGRGMYTLEADEQQKRVRFVYARRDGSTPDPAGILEDTPTEWEYLRRANPEASIKKKNDRSVPTSATSLGQGMPTDRRLFRAPADDFS